MKTSNPFLVSGYVAEEYFCDRENESKRIQNAIDNNRNILILSLRRMGKTGLIYHVFSRLKYREDLVLIYMDVLHCTNLGEFINEMGKAILNRYDGAGKRYYRHALNFITRLRPRMSFDPVSGMPSMDFQLKEPDEQQATLDQLLMYLNNLKGKIVIAIDEFQQVAQFPGGSTEALLRSRFQTLSNINLIFSGSQRQILMTMFHNQNRPFYQSAELLYLDRIPSDAYAQFIDIQFQKSGTVIERDAIESILRSTQSHTWYTQYLCNRIYESRHRHIDTKVVDEHLLKIQDEYESVYINYTNLLPRTQVALLKAIASQHGVSKPTASDFINRNGLGSASTVQTALKALLGKEMVYEESGSYLLYDVFFSHWLKRHYSQTT